MNSARILPVILGTLGLAFISVSLCAQGRPSPFMSGSMTEPTPENRRKRRVSKRHAPFGSLPVQPATARSSRATRPSKNKYVVKLQNAPKSIDIGIDKPGYHSLALCDLAGNEDHTLHVRLFSLKHRSLPQSALL